MPPRLLLTVLALAALSPARAESHAFNAAFWAPSLQTVPNTDDVDGIRLSLYGQNGAVHGLDLGVANTALHEVAGLEIGLWNGVSGDFAGVQLGGINRVGNTGCSAPAILPREEAPRMTGVQFGLWNSSREAEVYGVQCGIINTAKSVHGVQIGLVNLCGHLHGVQLGLWNRNEAKGWGEFSPLPKVVPFFNAGW